MKVDDLQDMLNVIRQLLASAGGKGAAELADFSAALDPFRDLTVKQLTNELSKLTEQPKVTKKKGAKLSPAQVDSLISDVRSLYERAGSPATTMEEILEITNRLHELGKADLVRAAEAIGLMGMKSKKSISAVAAEIRKRIEARMGANQRTEMIDV